MPVKNDGSGALTLLITVVVLSVAVIVLPPAVCEALREKVVP